MKITDKRKESEVRPTFDDLESGEFFYIGKCLCVKINIDDYFNLVTDSICCVLDHYDDTDHMLVAPVDVELIVT